MKESSMRGLAPIVTLAIAVLAALIASPAAAQQAKGKSDTARYIVVFKDSVGGPANLARAQTKQRGGKLGFVYRHALKGYSALLPNAAARALRRDPRVKHVTRDRKVIPLEEELIETEDHEGVEIFEHTIPTGLDRTFATTNEALNINGEEDLRVDVDVAVIDTGIDHEHPDLDVVARVDCVDATGNAECEAHGGVDGHSHGTHVAGTIGAIDNDKGVVGMAPGARMWAVKVLRDGGFGQLSWTVAGVDWVTAHANEIEVANMSLGCLCSAPALDEAIEASVEAGVIHVVAAGNDDKDAANYMPAGSPDAITVSALADYDGMPGGEASPTCANAGLDDRKATFSNFGNTIDIAAPGVCILSTEPDKRYGHKSGTSMASPHVAGAAALLASWDNPEDAEDVEAIRDAITEAGNFEWEDTSGDGVQEPLLDVSDDELFSPQAPPPTPLAITQAASEITTGIVKSKATLNAAVNPRGSATTYQFEYGTTTEYGFKVPTSPEGIGAGLKTIAVEAEIDDLEPDTTYHFRVVATSEEGTTYGVSKTFVTGPPPPAFFALTIGEEGTGAGQFDTPGGIAVDSNDDVWVADYGNSRVQHFNSAGEYLGEFGTSGTGNGQFQGLSRIAVDSSDGLWVTDSDRVQHFNSAGEYLGEFGTSGTGNGQFDNPVGIAVDSNDDVWVADYGNNRVQRFNSNGEYLDQFGEFGNGGGKFDGPTDVAVDSNGDIWVTDRGNNIVQGFNSAGEYLGEEGGSGRGDGQFDQPLGIAADSDDEVWVADRINHRVQHFTSPPLGPTGGYLDQFGERGVGDGQFEYPRDLAFDSEENIWVVDLGNDRIHKWSQGAPIATTKVANPVAGTSATLNATVNPLLSETTYQFEYGTTSEYGAKFPEEPASAGAGEGELEVSEKVEGLEPRTTYHFRIVAESAEGTTYGKDRTFTTKLLHPVRFVGETYPAVLSGGQAPEQKHVIAVGAGDLECEGAYLDGELKWAKQELALEAEYSGCEVDAPFSDGPASLEMNDCHYVLGLATTGPPYTGAMDIVCEGEEPIELRVYADEAEENLICLYEIGPQEGLEGLAYVNVGEGSGRAVEVEYGLESIAITRKEGSFWSCGLAEQSGSYEGASVLGGSGEKEEPVGIFAGEPENSLHFLGETYPAVLSGGQAPEQKHVIAVGAGDLECEGAYLDGELKWAKQELALEAEYSGCEVDAPFSDGPASLEMNDCHYVLGLATTGPPYTGAMDIVCEGEEPIELRVYTDQAEENLVCLYEIGPQEGLEGLGYVTVGEGSDRAVEVELGLENIEITRAEGSFFSCGAAEQLGSYEGASVLGGAGEEEEPVGIFVRKLAHQGLFLAGEESEEGAAQPRFEVEAHPATVAGGQAPEQKHVIAVGAGDLECEEVYLDGELEQAAQELALEAKYAGCEIDGPFSDGPASLEMNDCHYVLGLANVGPPYTGAMDIACEGEEPIELRVYTDEAEENLICLYEIGPQENLEGLGYANVGGGGDRAVEVEYGLESIAITRKEGSFFSCGLAEQSGSHAGVSVLNGF